MYFKDKRKKERWSLVQGEEVSGGVKEEKEGRRQQLHRQKRKNIVERHENQKEKKKNVTSYDDSGFHLAPDILLGSPFTRTGYRLFLGD